MVRDAEVAEDLVQESFLAAAESLNSFEKRSAFYTWLYGILLNKFRGWLRSREKAVSLENVGHEEESSRGHPLFQSDAPQPFERLELSETSGFVHQALEELPAHHRTVLMLRYLEDLSYEQIAQVLGCSIGTVKSRIHYALKRITAKLRPHVE